MLCSRILLKQTSNVNSFAANSDRVYPYLKLAKNKITEDPKELFQLKGFRSPVLVGFHGTNLDAVKQLLKTGYLPAGKVYFEHLPGQGFGKPALYMTAISSRVPRNLIVAIRDSHSEFQYHDFLHHQMSLETAWNSARIYAQILAEDSNFLKYANMNFNDENRHRMATLEFDSDGMPNRNHPWPIKLQKKYLEYLEQIRDQKSGIILGIHKSIFKELTVIFDGDEGLRIELPPEGLVLKYIYSIIPIGLEEKNFFLK